MGKKGSKRTKKFLNSGGLQSKISQRVKRQKVRKLRAEQKVSRTEKRLEKRKGRAATGPQEAQPAASAEDGKDAGETFGDMALDDFLGGGFLQSGESDDDESDDEQDEAAEPAAETSADTNDTNADTDEMSAHQKELNDLKKSDPEFHKFLLESKSDLLQFEDTNDDGSDGDQQEGEDEGDAPADDKHGDDDEEEEEEDDRTIVLTPQLFKSMKVAVFEKKSLRGLTRLIQAFRSGCHLGQEEDTGSEKKSRPFVFQVKDSSVFNDLMISSIENMAGVFSHHLKWKGATSGSLPTSCAKWERLRPAISSFCGNLMHFLSQLADEEMKLFVLQSLEPYVPFLAALSKLHRRVVKALLKVWGAANEDSVSVRLSAFMRLRQLVILAPASSQVVNNCLKGIYLTHVRNSKFVNEFTAPGVAMRRNCVVEMFLQRPQVSYQQVFVYIRQLAITLRLALSKPSADAVRSVYNWQFLESLRTWTQLLCAAATTAGGAGSALRPLVYPLVQIIRGAATLQPTAPFMPMRLHCFVLINDLSAATDVYVPAVPMLLAVLGSAPLRSGNKKGKGKKGVNKNGKGKMLKPPVLDLVLRFQKAALDAGLVQDQVVLRTLALLTDYFKIHRHSIAFPELLFPAQVQLRQFLKTCKKALWRQAVRQLLKDAQKWADTVREARMQVDFGPSDTAKVARFMHAEKAVARQERLKNPLLAKWQLDELMTGAKTHGPHLPTAGRNGKGKGDGEDEEQKEKKKTQKKKQQKQTPSESTSSAKRRRAREAAEALGAEAANTDAPDEVGDLEMSSSDGEESE